MAKRRFKTGVKRMSGATAYRNSRLRPDPRDRSVDEVGRFSVSRVSLARQAGVPGPGLRLQVCPECKSVFKYAKVVKKGRKHVSLRCPVCGAKLGKVKRKQFQFGVDR